MTLLPLVSYYSLFNRGIQAVDLEIIGSTPS